MSESVPTSIIVSAGAVAVGVSAKQSIGNAESLYRASLEQIINGRFDLILSDILGLLSVTVIIINLWLTLRRDKRNKQASRD